VGCLPKSRAQESFQEVAMFEDIWRPNVLTDIIT
jgi:hypothetical protein